jgi:hypothetical protein
MNRDVKAERLAAALRENLKRRKAQARGRKAGDAPEPDAIDTDNPASRVTTAQAPTELKD